MKSPFKKQLSLMLTIWHRMRGATDLQRWKGQENLLPGWDARTRRIADLIPDHVTVLEFGAGRGVLKTYLKEGCTYTPSDLIDRGDGTLVCDLNGKTLPIFPRHDYAVFSGVLEYVHDLPRLIMHLSGSVNVIVASCPHRD